VGGQQKCFGNLVMASRFVFLDMIQNHLQSRINIRPPKPWDRLLPEAQFSSAG
jgi:hypothetical protein